MGKTLYRSHDDSRRNAAWRISHINLAGRRLVLGGFPQRDFQLHDGLARIVARINSLSCRGPQIKRNYASCVATSYLNRFQLVQEGL